MNIRVKDEDLAIMKFAIGQPVRRVEDASLLQGRGQYTDDVNRPGQVYCAMVRSQQAHGILRGIDIEAARAMPGVIAIYTGADLAIAGYGAMPFRVALQGRGGAAPPPAPCGSLHPRCRQRARRQSRPGAPRARAQSPASRP